MPPSSLHTHGHIRVAAVSPALHLGDPEANAREIAAAIREANSAGCHGVVFPELSLTGYSCADLFMNSGFLQRAYSALDLVRQASSGFGGLVIVGLPLAVDDRLYNVAAVLCSGQLLGYVPKSHLPNSWEFYERRWFSPASTLSRRTVTELGEEIPIGTDLLFVSESQPHCRIAVEICEDLWSVIPPSSHAALQGATILANLSASNELLGKADYRRQLVAQQSGRCLAGYIYAAAGPGESTTDVVYGGHSLIAENGTLLAEAERFDFSTTMTIADIDTQRLAHERLHSTSFRDDKASQAPWRRIPFCLVDNGTLPSTASELRRPLSRHPFVPASPEARSHVCYEIFAIQATGLARRLRHTNSQTLVLGLSGGLDSTLALLVALDAVYRAGTACQVLAVTMPGLGTTARTKDNASLLAKALDIELRTVSISDAVTRHLADIQHPLGQHDVTFENSQARERTQILMDLANQTNGLVLGTGDLSESALGWCTFNGDHMSMYHVNAGVPKTLVRYLIAWCAEQPAFSAAASVLRDILDTPISPELLPADASGKIAQKTEDSIGPYELNDFFLYHHIRHGSSREKIAWLASLAFEGSYTTEQIDIALTRYLTRFRTQQFKRSSMPDGPKVGTVALSPRGDWRMPSDAVGM